MRGLNTLILTQGRLFLREPAAVFFTIFYAPLLLIIFGSIWGNDPNPEFGNLGTIDISIPSYIALIVATVSLMGLPISLSTDKESGILRRYFASGMKPFPYVLSYIMVFFVQLLLGTALLLAVGFILFQVSFHGNWGMLILSFLLSALCFFAIGFLLASLVKTTRVAQALGLIILFPMIFLSGAALPSEILPQAVRTISQILPLTHAVKLLRGFWFNQDPSGFLLEFVVLISVILICTAISLRLFKWKQD